MICLLLSFSLSNKKTEEEKETEQWRSWTPLRLLSLLHFKRTLLPMTTSSISQYLVAEPDDPLNDAGGQIQAPLQNYLRERLMELRTRNYSNSGIADAKAIEKLTSEFEILVFGPARVGKSTLIRELSGDEEIRTSTGLNSCTQKTTAYTDQFGVRWWDTRGTT